MTDKIEPSTDEPEGKGPTSGTTDAETTTSDLEADGKGATANPTGTQGS